MLTMMKYLNLSSLMLYTSRYTSYCNDVTKYLRHRLSRSEQNYNKSKIRFHSGLSKNHAKESLVVFPPDQDKDILVSRPLSVSTKGLGTRKGLVLLHKGGEHSPLSYL